MSLTKLERDKQKLVQDKCQQILSELLRDEDNKYCVDCDSKGPRWASWNLGIFLCIRCAGIHRNLGVHISKVKSVNLDSWTPEQVGSIQNMGNSKARAVYEANLPDNFCRPQVDTALESFIRAKYEHKKYIAKEWVETPPKPAFDVETELKKEKEKKKNKIKPIAPISTQTEIQSNSIPRPTPNANGKIEKVQQQQKIESTQSSSADLLSLDLGSSTSNNETFGFFTSAETKTTTTTKTTATTTTTTTATTTTRKLNDINQSTQQPTKTLDDEEKDFFSQKTFEKKDEKKLTKESILSLYSQTPTNSTMINGGFQPPSALLSTNQFSNVNPLFNPTNQANMIQSSTNPFLTNNNPLLMSGEYQQKQQQKSLIQGISSLHLQSNQIPINNVSVASNTHLNWFNTGGIPTINNLGSSSSAIMANPFIEQSLTKNQNQVNVSTNLKSNGNTADEGSGNDPMISIDKKNDNFNLNFW